MNDGFEICWALKFFGIDPEAWPEMNWSDHTGAMSIWPDESSWRVWLLPLG